MIRKQHWENVYQQKLPTEVSWYQADPHDSLDFIKATKLGKDASIIDVGGGASLLTDHLLDLGYSNLTVLDISYHALKHTQQRLSNRAHSIQWIESDITEFEPHRLYDIWHDRAVFHFLTRSKDRQQYIQNLKNSLHPGSHFIISAFTIGGPNQCSNLEIVQYDKAKMNAELGNEFQLITNRNVSHITPAGKEQKFSYFHYILR